MITHRHCLVQHGLFIYLRLYVAILNIFFTGRWRTQKLRKILQLSNQLLIP